MPSPIARPRRALAAALVLTLAVVTACSSSEGDDASSRTSTTAPARSSTTTKPGDAVADATETDYVDAFATNLSKTEGVFSDDGVRCLAGRWVEAIGADALREAGVPPGDIAASRARLDALDIDRPTAEAMADAFGSCGLALRDAYLRALQGDLSEQGKACMDDLLTEDAVRRSFVADLLGEELDPDPLTQVERCAR